MDNKLYNFFIQFQIDSPTNERSYFIFNGTLFRLFRDDFNTILPLNFVNLKLDDIKKLHLIVYGFIREYLSYELTNIIGKVATEYIKEINEIQKVNKITMNGCYKLRDDLFASIMNEMDVQI